MLQLETKGLEGNVIQRCNCDCHEPGVNSPADSDIQRWMRRCTGRGSGG